MNENLDKKKLLKEINDKIEKLEEFRLLDLFRGHNREYQCGLANAYSFLSFKIKRGDFDKKRKQAGKKK